MAPIEKRESKVAIPAARDIKSPVARGKLTPLNPNELTSRATVSSLPNIHISQLTAFIPVTRSTSNASKNTSLAGNGPTTKLPSLAPFG